MHVRGRRGRAEPLTRACGCMCVYLQVLVFRLVTNTPVEDRVLNRATEKQNMEAVVIEAGNFNTSANRKGAADRKAMLEELLDADQETVCRNPCTPPHGVCCCCVLLCAAALWLLLRATVFCCYMLLLCAAACCCCCCCCVLLLLYAAPSCLRCSWLVGCGNCCFAFVRRATMWRRMSRSMR